MLIFCSQASNPGLFEPEQEASWSKQGGSDTVCAENLLILLNPSIFGFFCLKSWILGLPHFFLGQVYHMGKVGIGTDHSTEALTVQGNIQVIISESSLNLTLMSNSSLFFSSALEPDDHELTCRSLEKCCTQVTGGSRLA